MKTSSKLRVAGWAAAMGLAAPLLQSFIALSLSGAIGSFAGLGQSGEAQAALGQAALSALLALCVLGLAVLAGLAVELTRWAGAWGGALAAAVPALVLWFGEGLDALGPPLAAAVRVAGLVAAIAAGVGGIQLGRRAVRPAPAK